MARRRTGFAKKIEVVHWTYGSFTVEALATGTAAAVNVFSAQHLPETWMRTRGDWAAAFSAAIAGNTAVGLAAGLILVPEGTGNTVLWSPISDGDAPWVWWDAMELIYQEYVVDVVSSQLTSSASKTIDSKAMRKVRNTEVQFVVEQNTLGGLNGAAIDVFGQVRALTGS